MPVANVYMVDFLVFMMSKDSLRYLDCFIQCLDDIIDDLLNGIQCTGWSFYLSAAKIAFHTLCFSYCAIVNLDIEFQFLCSCLLSIVYFAGIPE